MNKYELAYEILRDHITISPGVLQCSGRVVVNSIFVGEDVLKNNKGEKKERE